MNGWQSCPKCGSSDVISGVRVVDHSDSGTRDLSLSFPGATLVGPLRMTKLVPLEALVCATCGYSELYVKDATELREARDRSHRGAGGGAGHYQTPVIETSSGSRAFVLVAVCLAVLLALGMVALVLIMGTLGAK